MLATLVLIVAVGVAAFTGSLAGVYCGLRIAVPAMKALLEG